MFDTCKHFVYIITHPNQTEDEAKMNQLVKIQPSELVVQTEHHIEKRDIVSRNLAIANNHVFQDAVSRFANYTDPSGKPATAPGKWTTSVNTAIAKAYGANRENLSGLANIHCSCLLGFLAEIINKGIDSSLLRKTIRKDVSNLIVLFGQQYREVISIL